MFQFILYCLLAWFLYKIIFRFIIPVYRASRQVRQQFRKMQQTMEEQARRQQAASASQQQGPPKQPGNQKPAGDYIDFEEIK